MEVVVREVRIKIKQKVRGKGISSKKCVGLVNRDIIRRATGRKKKKGRTFYEAFPPGGPGLHLHVIHI